MGFGNFNLDFGESGSDFVCKDGNHGIFCMEVTGINQIDAKVVSIPELVVFYIGSDKGIAACIYSVPQFSGAGTATDCDFMDSLAAVNIAQAFTTQIFLNRREESFKGLLGYFAAAQ